jgi:hypothetical protein
LTAEEGVDEDSADVGIGENWAVGVTGKNGADGNWAVGVTGKNGADGNWTDAVIDDDWVDGVIGAIAADSDCAADSTDSVGRIGAGVWVECERATAGVSVDSGVLAGWIGDAWWQRMTGDAAIVNDRGPH